MDEKSGLFTVLVPGIYQLTFTGFFVAIRGHMVHIMQGYTGYTLYRVTHGTLYTGGHRVHTLYRGHTVHFIQGTQGTPYTGDTWCTLYRGTHGTLYTGGNKVHYIQGDT